MAESIGDIANESKAILEDIRTNTLGTRNNTSQIITELDAGFANLAGGLSALVQLGAQANQLAAANVDQNKAIICWLDAIAHVLCEMKRDLDASLQEQGQTNSRLGHLDAILELAHAREAMEVATRDRLQAEIEACCPPEQPEPAPCFDDCASPQIRPFKPVKVDWTPIASHQTEAPK